MTAFFDCSKSGRRSIVLGLDHFDVFRRAILAASHAAFSMVIQSEADGSEAGFRPTRSRPTTYPVSHLIGCKPISVYASNTKIAA